MRNDITPYAPRLDYGQVPGAEELERRFTYHPPKGDQVLRYQAIRDSVHETARIIAETVPPSREKSLALTHLEEAVMWANAGIARNE